MRRSGGDLKRAVAELLVAADCEVDVCELRGGADGSLHADFERLDEVIAYLRPGVPVIALGSGTITDLATGARRSAEAPDARRVRGPGADVHVVRRLAPG